MRCPERGGRPNQNSGQGGGRAGSGRTRPTSHRPGVRGRCAGSASAGHGLLLASTVVLATPGTEMVTRVESNTGRRFTQYLPLTHSNMRNFKRWRQLSPEFHVQLAVPHVLRTQKVPRSPLQRGTQVVSV